MLLSWHIYIFIGTGYFQVKHALLNWQSSYLLLASWLLIRSQMFALPGKAVATVFYAARHMCVCEGVGVYYVGICVCVCVCEACVCWLLW